MVIPLILLTPVMWIASPIQVEYYWACESWTGFKRETRGIAEGTLAEDVSESGFSGTRMVRDRPSLLKSTRGRHGVLNWNFALSKCMGRTRFSGNFPGRQNGAVDALIIVRIL